MCSTEQERSALARDELGGRAEARRRLACQSSSLQETGIPMRLQAGVLTEYRVPSDVPAGHLHTHPELAESYQPFFPRL